MNPWLYLGIIVTLTVFYNVLIADQRRTIKRYGARIDSLFKSWGESLDTMAEQSVEIIEAEHVIAVLLADIPGGRVVSLDDVQAVIDAGHELKRTEHESGDVTWRLA